MADKRNHRRSIRLKGYDYSQNGLYFITICIHNHVCLLGNVLDGEMILNDVGELIEKQWLGLTSRFQQIKIDEFVIMPNHFHAIVEFSSECVTRRGNPLWLPSPLSLSSPLPLPQPTPHSDSHPISSPTLGDVIGTFKSLSTNAYIQQVKQNNWPRFDKYFWQRNYYEHIIRNEASHLKISQYIQDNPLKWQEDKYYT